MGKKIYGIIEAVALWCLEILFKILHKELTPKIRQTFIEFVKFGLVGVSNTIISTAINWAAIYILEKTVFTDEQMMNTVGILLANFIAFALSVLWSFYWNNKYVFTKKDGEKRNVWAALFKTYCSYAVTGIVLNSLMLLLWVNVLHINKYIATIVNLIVNVPINFFLNKLWAFKKK